MFSGLKHSVSIRETLCFNTGNKLNRVADSHVWAPVVVEVDVALYHAVGMFKGVEALLALDTFHLYFSVDALSDGVVGGIIVLAHRDGYLMCL